MTTYKFTTPVVEEGPSGMHRLFYFFKLNRGLSVAKANGTYFTIRWPSQDVIESYDEFYLGGHEHSVSEATKDALIAAGIGIDETNFVAE
jgi:hypothetical protein